MNFTIFGRCCRPIFFDRLFDGSSRCPALRAGTYVWLFSCPQLRATGTTNRLRLARISMEI